MKKRAEIFVAIASLLITVVAIGAFFRLVKESQVDQANLVKELEETDSLIAADLQQQLKTYLSALPTDHPISERFGRFIAIEGTGWHREGEALANRPISLQRQVRFENSTVSCDIKVTTHGPLKFDVEMVPPGTVAEQSNRMSAQSSLVVTVTHPDFNSNASVVRETLDANASVRQVFDSFVEGVNASDQQRLTEVRQWYESQRGGRSIDAFMRLALGHPDESVRLKAAEFVATPSGGSRKMHFPDSMMNELLITLQDEDQPVAVRRQLVFAILQGYESDRTALYEQLRRSGVAGLFAVTPIAQFITDRSQRHWQASGAFDAPTGAAELLQEWGPDAEEAVPALIVALKEHPNHWDFAPAVARALGAMGENAREAIDALQLATTSNYGSLRKAAAEALDGMLVTKPSRIGEPLQFPSPEVREQFYPLHASTTFSWLSGNQNSLMILRSEGDKASLYKASLQTALCEHVMDLEVGKIQSVVGTGDNFLVLRLDEENGKKTLFADTWSISRRKRIKITTVFQLRAVDLNQTTAVEYIVWSDDRTKVAFEQAVRTPYKRGHTESRDLQIKSLDQPNPEPDDRLDEYLMTPIGFSSKRNLLYLDGWCFGAKANGLASLELDTHIVTPLLSDTKSVTRLSHQRGDHDWIVIDRQSGQHGSTLKLLDPDSMSTQQIVLDQELAYFAQPWEPALAFASSGQWLAVATLSGVEIFDTTTGHRVEQRTVLLPGSPFKLRPMMMAADRQGFVLAATNGMGPQRKDPSTKNELRLIRIEIDE